MNNITAWDTKHTDCLGRTVLHYGFIHIEIVKYLITECNYDPMVTDKDGKTVLHYAVERNRLDVVDYLVLTGSCDPILAANKYGNTVLLFAAQNGFHNNIIFKCLIENHKSNPMVTDEYGKTVLHYAVEQNRLDIVEYLLSTGQCDPIIGAYQYDNIVQHFAATIEIFLNI